MSRNAKTLIDNENDYQYHLQVDDRLSNNGRESLHASMEGLKFMVLLRKMEDAPT